MKKLLLPLLSTFILVLFAVRPSFAQKDKPLHKDVQYYILANNLVFNTDVISATSNLVQFAEQNYTEKDYNYFNAYFTGGVYLQKVKPLKALAYLEKAIAVYNVHYTSYLTNDHNQLIDAHLSIAIAWQSLGLLSTSIQFLEDHKDILEKVSNAMNCKYYNKLGDLYLMVKDHENARCYYDKSGKILASGELMVLIKKDHPSAVKKQLMKSEPMIRDFQTYFYNIEMGHLFLEEEKYDSAVVYLKKSQEQSQKFMEQGKNVGKVSRFTKMILPDSILQMSKEAENYTKLMNELGGIDLELITALQKAGIKEEARIAADTWLEEAHFYHLVGELDKARKIYDTIYSRLAELDKTKYFKKTSQSWKEYLDPVVRTLECARNNFDQPLNETRIEIGNDDQNLEESFPFFSEYEKREYFDSYVKKLQFYYSVLLASSKKDPSLLAEILNKSLQTKGLILDVSKRQQGYLKNIKDTLVLNDLKRIKLYRDHLLALNQILVKKQDSVLSDSAQYYKESISQLQKKVNQQVGISEKIIKDVTWKNVQSVLKPNEVYVEIIKIERDYFMLGKPVTEYWAFFLSGSGEPRATFLGGGRDFEKGIKAYQNNIRYKLLDTLSYNRYWKKIAEETKGKAKVYVSCDGIYHLLNPLSLYNPLSKKFVLEEISVVRISSGRDLLKKDPKSDLAAAVLIGNPDFAMKRKASLSANERTDLSEVLPSEKKKNQEINLLPGTEKEIYAIAEIAKVENSPVKLMTKSEATEDKVKQVDNPSLLHFATHGVFEPYHTSESFLRSKLVLAGAGDGEEFTLEDYVRYEDGFLTAFEVTQMDLSQTNLVVMSACESALGDIQGGEGVWGLQRAFQVAGARSVLGSLWKINDETTAFFMESFYKKYFETKSVSSAYYHAMKSTKEKYPEPYYWGAFVVIGE